MAGDWEDISSNDEWEDVGVNKPKITAAPPTMADKLNQIIYNFKQKAEAPISIGGKPVDIPSAKDIAHGMESAGLGGAQWAGPLKAGLNKGADIAMRAATGLEKPGLGNILAREGVWGFPSSMAKQASNKLPQVENELQGVIEANMGKSVDSGPIAQALEDKARQFMTSSGRTSKAAQGSLDEIGARAADVESRGLLSPAEALDFKRMAGREGFGSAGHRSGLSDELARTEAEGYRSALEQLDPRIAEQLTKEQALIGAKNMPSGVNLLPAAKSLMTGHPIRATIQATPLGPLGLSAASRGMQLGADTLPNASSMAGTLNYLFRKPSNKE